MIKYNTLFKQQVIEFYLQNGKNRSLTRKYFQLAKTTLEHWINQFNHSGIGAKSNFLGQNISGLFYIAKNPAKMTAFNDLAIAERGKNERI